jgi:hypothetical protein
MADSTHEKRSRNMMREAAKGLGDVVGRDLCEQGRAWSSCAQTPASQTCYTEGGIEDVFPYR